MDVPYQEINFYAGAGHPRAPAVSGALLARSLLLTVGALGLIYAYTWGNLEQARLEMAVVAEQETAARARLENLRPIMAAVTNETRLAGELDTALRTLDQKRAVLALVDDANLGDTRGFSRHLRALAAGNLEGLWLTRIRLSAAEHETELEGRAREAELVPAYLEGLTSESPFTALGFQQFQITRAERAKDEVIFAIDSAPYQEDALAAFDPR